VAGCYTTTGQIVRDNPTGTLIPAAVAGSPCTNLGDVVNGNVVPKVAKGDGTTPKLTFTWKPSGDLLLYATFSEGFRPGGINRRATVEPYKADFLENMEIGYKGTLDEGRLRINAALYRQKWKDFQFSFLGANSFTEIHNGPDATINGFESDFSYTPNRNMTFNGSFAYTDAKTDKNLCAVDDPTFTCAGFNRIDAPAGTRLPVTPKIKFAGSMRYKWDWKDYKPYWQIAVNNQSDAISDLRVNLSTALGDPVSATLKGFSLFDLALGGEIHGWSAELYVKNATDERASLTRSVECGQCYQRPYYYVSQPRTFGVRIGSKY
jgi:outer membrane receptor protein involved in Fe transport